MMAIEDGVPENAMTPKADPSPISDRSHTISSHPRPHIDEPSPMSKKPRSQEDFILSVASKIASQPLQNSDPDVWGVLTSISANALKKEYKSFLNDFNMHTGAQFFV